MLKLKLKKKKSLVIVAVSILILIIAVLAVLIPKRLNKPKAGIGCGNNISTSDCFCTTSSCYANEKVDGKWVTNKWEKSTSFVGSPEEGYTGTDGRKYQGIVDNPAQNAPNLGSKYGSGGNSQGKTGNRDYSEFSSASPSPSPSPRPKFGKYIVQQGYSFDNTPLRILIDLWLRYNGLR